MQNLPVCQSRANGYLAQEEPAPRTHQKFRQILALPPLRACKLRSAFRNAATCENFASELAKIKVL